MHDGCVFQQTFGIVISTHSAPLLADLFLYPYEADFIQFLLKNFTFCYIELYSPFTK
jgi:hypothetical protein